MTRPPRSPKPYDPAMDSPSLPVLVLTAIGAIVAVLGLFAAGDVRLVLVGMGAVAVAGVLHVLERRKK